MTSKPRKLLALLATVAMLVSFMSACNSPAKKETGKPTTSEAPTVIKIMMSDNPTFPYKEDWLVVQEAEKKYNVKFDISVNPNTDHTSKVQLALNSGMAPDIMTNLSAATGVYADFGLNGVLLPVNKYFDKMPNFTKTVKDWGLEGELKNSYLADGNLYYAPALWKEALYDSGPHIRTDLLEEYGLKAPTTYDELYKVCKVFKEKNPDSYPITIYLEPRIVMNFTTEAYGIQVGKGAPGYVASYDRANKQYIDGMTSPQFKDWLTFMNKLYSEKLLDKEIRQDGDKWLQKLATGKSFFTWCWYDQRDSIINPGKKNVSQNFKFDMLMPLTGPAGQYTQAKSRVATGMLISSEVAKKPTFDKIIKFIDDFFYSEEGSSLAHIGKEGVTYNMLDGKIKFTDSVVNNPMGLGKGMQVDYGVGINAFLLRWDTSKEIAKFDPKFGQLAQEATQKGVILPTAPSAKFTTDQAEEVALIKAPLADMFEKYADGFITGQYSLEKDWDEYVKKVKSLNIDKLVQTYNDASK